MRRRFLLRTEPSGVFVSSRASSSSWISRHIHFLRTASERRRRQGRRPAGRTGGTGRFPFGRIPRPISDDVRFSVTSSITVARQQPCVLDVWAHTADSYETVLDEMYAAIPAWPSRRQPSLQRSGVRGAGDDAGRVGHGAGPAVVRRGFRGTGPARSGTPRSRSPSRPTHVRAITKGRSASMRRGSRSLASRSCSA